MLIAMNSIDVENRYRKEFGDLNSLALSINQFGLLQPIVVEPRGNRFLLIAGERRFRAHEILKRTEIEANLKEELNDLQRVQLELEENLHRKDFTWQEEVTIKSKIHSLQLQIHGEKAAGRSSGAWTIEDTAELINQSKTVVAGDIDLAKGLVKYPELNKEKNKTSAFKKLKQLEEERMRKVLATRIRERGVPVDLHEKVMHGDCTHLLKKIPDHCIHLVLTDPPYGIDYDSHIDSDNSAGYTPFADDKMGSFDTIELMLTELQRVMCVDSGIFMFCSITFVQPLMEMLKRYGFDPDPMPLIWNKQNLGGGRVTVPDRDHARTYEVIIYARRGRRALIKQGQPNILSVDVLHHSKKLHPTEKPTALLRELITRASIEGETILDPCAGSGSALVAAQQTNREFIGIEKEEHYYTVILQRLAAKTQSDDSKKEAIVPKPKAVIKELKNELSDLLGDLEEEQEEIAESLFGGANLEDAKE